MLMSWGSIWLRRWMRPSSIQTHGGRLSLAMVSQSRSNWSHTYCFWWDIPPLPYPSRHGIPYQCVVCTKTCETSNLCCYFSRESPPSPEGLTCWDIKTAKDTSSVLSHATRQFAWTIFAPLEISFFRLRLMNLCVPLSDNPPLVWAFYIWRRANWHIVWGIKDPARRCSGVLMYYTFCLKIEFLWAFFSEEWDWYRSLRVACAEWEDRWWFAGWFCGRRWAAVMGIEDFSCSRYWVAEKFDFSGTLGLLWDPWWGSFWRTAWWRLVWTSACSVSIYNSNK